MTLTEARNHIGRWVIYRPADGKPRKGRILSVGSWKVNLYLGGGALAKAVDPADLELAMAVTR